MNRTKYNKLYRDIFKNEDKLISSQDELVDFLKEMKSVKPEKTMKLKQKEE